MDKETSQMIIAGMGELHLEISIERLRREYGLNIDGKQQKVSYRETIKRKSEKITAEIKRQTGGAGSYAKVVVIFEPNPGKGYEFVDGIRGDAISDKFAKATGEGIKSALLNGLLLGYPTVDVKATLVDGQTHEVDSKEMNFREAGELSFRGEKGEKEKRIEQFKVVLLEPIMEIEVTIPKDYRGTIIANLSSKRAVIENTDEEERDVIIKGKAPLKEMLSYSTELRKATQGKGGYTMRFFNYQEVPRDVLSELVNEHKLIKGSK
jgi:elongation factor G